METPPVELSTYCEKCHRTYKEVELTLRRQNTQYSDDASNWATYCTPCQEEADMYWRDMWQEYYASVYGL